MDRAYALYLSYNRWLHEIPLDCVEFMAVADATGDDPSHLDECWDEGQYPDGEDIIVPEDDDIQS
jgi:hypothetical protein